MREGRDIGILAGETARKLNISRMEAWRRGKSGELPVIGYVGKVAIFDRHSVEQQAQALETAADLAIVLGQVS